MLFAAVLVCILGFSTAKRQNRYISLILFGLGVYFLQHYQAAPAAWLKAGVNNAAVICLVLTVPLLGIPLHFEPYQQHLSKLIPQYVRSPYSFYVLVVSLVAGLSTLLNLANYPFVFQLFKDIAANFPQKLFHKALIRGFIPNMMWSPSFISMALVTQFTHTTWVELIPVGLAMAVLWFIFALVFGAFECRNLSGSIQASILPKQEIAVARQGVSKLSLQMLLLIFLIVLLQYFTRKSALVVVPLVAFVGPLILALVFKRLSIYSERVCEYYTVSLPAMHNEVILFTAIGFFGYGLGISPVQQYIPFIIRELGFHSPAALMPLIMLLVVLPSMFGVHPIISMSAVAVALPPGLIPLTEIQMAVALLTGYMLYASLSPFSVVSLVLSSFTKVDSINLSLRQNHIYSLLLAAITTLILTFISI